MTRENNPPRQRGRFTRFVEELYESSDRSVAIVSAAWLSELLKRLIASCLIDEPEKTNTLLESQIDNFSIRINVAHCLGLTTEDEFSDLRSIRRIRNWFAHKLDVAHFDADGVSARCSQLRLPRRYPLMDVSSATARELFICSVGLLTGALRYRPNEVGDHPEVLTDTGKMVVASPMLPHSDEVVADVIHEALLTVREMADCDTLDLLRARFESRGTSDITENQLRECRDEMDARFHRIISSDLGSLERGERESLYAYMEMLTEMRLHVIVDQATGQILAVRFG